MNTCSNCGATLRPDAKFCTTCGTRLNQAAPPNDGWNTPRNTSKADSQETSVIESVTPPESTKETSITGNDNQREYDRWTAAYAGSSSNNTDDPASRFISALEDRENSVSDEQEDPEAPVEESVDPASTWVTPPPSATSWNYQAKTEPATDFGSADASTDHDDWKAPSTWGRVETDPVIEVEAEPEVETEVAPEVEAGPIGGQPSAPIEIDKPVEEESDKHEDVIAVEPSTPVEIDIDTDEETELEGEPDAAGFREGGVNEVDFLSGDENIAVSGPITPALDPNDARARAIELVDELRRTVRMMPGGGQQDLGAAAMSLTEASLNLSDFSDVREVLDELQEDSRDIQALSNLARKADKIELLLDEHASLAEAIETALKELNAAG